MNIIIMSGQFMAILDVVMVLDSLADKYPVARLNRW
jgi:hypothetical protein